MSLNKLTCIYMLGSCLAKHWSVSIKHIECTTEPIQNSNILLFIYLPEWEDTDTAAWSLIGSEIACITLTKMNYDFLIMWILLFITMRSTHVEGAGSQQHTIKHSLICLRVHLLVAAIFSIHSAKASITRSMG